jgi:hypothetical protein
MKHLKTIALLYVLSLTLENGFAAERTVRTTETGFSLDSRLDKKKALARLREIERMDLGTLSAAERKTIREEVLHYRHEIGKENPYIFISSISVLILILCYVILAALRVFD